MKKNLYASTFSIRLVLLVTLTSCSPKPKSMNMVLATTTQLQESGIIDALVTAFEQKTGYMVQVTAAEATAVLQLGEKGDADVLLLNSSKGFEEFMSKGYGKERSLVMHTNYILVGPKNHPAAIKGISVLDAFTKIYNTQTAFVSCGDNSTVKKKEVAIWKKAGLTPAGDWYTKTGQEIAATLQVASEKGAYTFPDLSTFLNQKDTLQLDIMIEKDATLISAIYVINGQSQVQIERQLLRRQGFCRLS